MKYCWEKPIRNSVAFSGSSLTFGPDRLAAQCDWHYLTSWARGEEKQRGGSAKLNLSSEAELTYSWNWTLLEDGVGSSSEQACCWLAAAAPALQTSGVCVCVSVCVCEEKVFPSATSLAPKEPQLKQTLFLEWAFLSCLYLKRRVLRDSFALQERGAKNSCRWPGNVEIEFIFVGKRGRANASCCCSHMSSLLTFVVLQNLTVVFCDMWKKKN